MQDIEDAINAADDMTLELDLETGTVAEQVAEQARQWASTGSLGDQIMALCETFKTAEESADSEGDEWVDGEVSLEDDEEETWRPLLIKAFKAGWERREEILSEAIDTADNRGSF